VAEFDRRVATATLIAETGRGPDGSSLTANYRRSMGSGAEKRYGPPPGESAATSVA